ncbi:MULTISPECIES: hypothetical protein [Streptomycetaceae]|uniref:Putative secreted protein n=1 Tax=Streptantibioticus cattleyicolor (strain ATCC 35852 / DSM 46488 / JCM 4925 / NBRC 14057 / NRRL 8057) TaxID=1003195 RepID=G8WRV0_STREN|nr:MULTISPECIES: hypothetical protein [Streptomycetaceae]AEW94234.1 putative secreted protein [Streptantibioticus cattleyicolor NRRL 8057 = DSM 46488]MYS58892.1 hypothetical protein [Streptomyces sp. SID5468]
MRRGLAHAGAWAAATGTAVALSWLGVHAVLAGTVYDPPRALPVPAGGPGAQPVPSVSAVASAPPAPRPSVSAPARPSPSVPPAPSTPAAPSATPGSGGGVRGYQVTGGRVALDMGASSATLVSATPEPGWSMRVWKQPGWIRVDFTSGNRTSSVFCTWNGHPPTVQTYGS